MSTHHVWLVTALAVGSMAIGCGGTPTAPQEDETFYLHQRGVIDYRYAWERYFPRLDREAGGRLPQRVGVAVMEGDVVMSRPIDWYLRSADYSAEQRIISYQSPRQFVRNIYERTDSTRLTWNEVLKRYEEAAEKAGSSFLKKRIPLATANAQARAYEVKTALPGRDAGDAFAHEILVRSSNRILLVQIVHGEKIDDSIDEMLDVVKSMLVY